MQEVSTVERTKVPCRMTSKRVSILRVLQGGRRLSAREIGMYTAGDDTRRDPGKWAREAMWVLLQAGYVDTTGRIPALYWLTPQGRDFVVSQGSG